MPWKERSKMSEKVKFIDELFKGERMTDACKKYGISRKTGYKVLRRFIEYGEEAFIDNSRRPIRSPNKTPEAIVDYIVEFRNKHPTWGPKKIKAEMEKREQGIKVPASSTIGEILSKRELVKRRKRKRRAWPTRGVLTESKSPNEIWSADYKGQFRLRNNKYCYPLTISDNYSRYILRCEAQESTEGLPAKAVFAETFRKYGIPKKIRVDNGTPFSSIGLLGLSMLSVWWKRLGIEVERIEPGHPEQNGRHERMHLTLKQEACRPSSSNILLQQERFDKFVEEYNKKRPHEALGMKYPEEIYEKSKKRMPKELSRLRYPLDDYERKVQNNGRCNFKGTCYYISKSLANEYIGLREIEPEKYVVHFMEMELGILNKRCKEFIDCKKI